MTSKRIILHNFSFSEINIPSLELSILKGDLILKAFRVDIIYWNILFDKELSFLAKFFPLRDKNVIKLLPFIYHIVKELNDNNALERINSLLYSAAPNSRYRGNNYNLKILEDIFMRIDSIQNDTLKRLDLDDTFMVASFNNDIPPQIYQWIPALILNKKVKEIFPNIITICGSFLTSTAAIRFLTISKHSDYSIWGKVDSIVIRQMCEKYDNLDTEIENIPNAIYKRNNEIIYNKNKISDLTSDTSNEPIFNDFFDQNPNFNTGKAFFPIKTADGCSWNKCKFCFYKINSRYIPKKVSQIIQEIRKYNELYGITNFVFQDNDINGENGRIEEFLDSLIELSSIKQFNYVAELIPFNLTAEILKKIVIAGFKKIELGYESNNDTLLQKMNKKNSFADNIHFVKFARKFGLNISGGINLITEIPDETESDVIESINNLHFLRFFLNNDIFFHNISQLGIIKGTRYFNLISSDEKKYWNKNQILYLLPGEFNKEETRLSLFVCNREFHKNKLEWENFIEIEKFYKESNYSYRIFTLNGIYYYKEYLNKELIKSICFREDIYIKILKSINDKVCTLEEIIASLRNNSKNGLMERSKIVEILDELKSEYLIYINKEYTKIISIIDINSTLTD